ncbi:MAG TPA: STAS domain-containing protein [Azospirillaceae bacterium]|nr:STAS domain-containing protein [Azospirillaceae bacterium]HRQ79730.1 STAS domain-containing protein [Azospirillaceae bacterium]
MRIPILRLGEILLAPIQSDITDEQAMQLQAEILKLLEITTARGVVLDISALDVVDSYMARILTDTARMARLMGGEVVISGMNPTVAIALIEMGRELINVATALNLEQAVDALKARLSSFDDHDGIATGRSVSHGG